MRTKTTPWNRSYKHEDLARELVRNRPRGLATTKARKAVKEQAQRTFIINHDKRQARTPIEADRAADEVRRRAMEKYEEIQALRELREVWE